MDDQHSISSETFEDMQLPMFERSDTIKLTIGSISHSFSNLSVCYVESRNIFYAAVSHKAQVYVVTFDIKLENVNWECINVQEMWSERLPIITHATLVIPAIRVLPLLVIGTTQGVQIYDVRNQRLVVHAPIERPTEANIRDLRIDLHSFCRGITCNDNTIVVGNYRGQLMQFVMNSESTMSMKKPLQEHHNPVMDVATCKYDEVTCSADAGGEIIIWTKPVRAVSSRLNAGECVTAVNVLRKHVIAGTISGNMVLFSIMTSSIVARVAAHSRPITSLNVAPESAYILSASEDGRFIVYKLHTRKPGPFQVEYRYSEEIDDSIISGCQFTTARGSCILVACYDKLELLMYKIVKKPVNQV